MGKLSSVLQFCVSASFLFIYTISSAQQHGERTAINPAERIDKVMYKKVLKLKDGVLLVRLMTREPSVKALREAGQTRQADEMQQEQNTYNKKIISAFKSGFTFCPVYFFFSSYSQQV